MAALDPFAMAQQAVVFAVDLLLVRPVFLEHRQRVDRYGGGERVHLAADAEHRHVLSLGDRRPLEREQTVAAEPLFEVLVGRRMDPAVPEELVALEGVVERHPQHEHRLEPRPPRGAHLGQHPRLLVLPPEVIGVPVALLGVDRHRNGVHPRVVQAVHPVGVVGLVDLDAPEIEARLGRPAHDDRNQQHEGGQQEQIAAHRSIHAATRRIRFETCPPVRSAPGCAPRPPADRRSRPAGAG